MKIDVGSDDLENNFMTSYSLANLNPKLDYIGSLYNALKYINFKFSGDNPNITEKTIKIFKERLQNKPDAFGKK